MENTNESNKYIDEHLTNYSEFLTEKKNNQYVKKKPFFLEPCLNDDCLSCFGTGVKDDGSICVHYIVCKCPKCSYRF
jgi:hypothetical protein